MKDIYKTLVYVLSLVLIVGLLSWFCYSKGQESIQEQWDKEKTIAEEKLRIEIEKYNKLLQAHKTLSESIDKTLEEKQNEWQTRIDGIVSDFTKRMQSSDSRAELYRRQAQAGTSEAERLASHAAELDSHLERSISSIDKLSATVRLREDEIRLLADQIKADRLAIEQENHAQ